MSELKRVRVRILHPHRHDCAARCKAAEWTSPWWISGATEWRTKTGRAGKGHTLWLVATCIFGDTYGRKFKGACRAKAVVHSMDVGDALTNPHQLSTSAQRAKS